MVTLREAATVMLLRDDPSAAPDEQLEVFMLRRNLSSDFVGGAYVFPGGAIDDGDRAPELLDRCHGRDDTAASHLLGLDSGGLAYWVAAIRESFEEAGVLLARSLDTAEPVDVEGASKRFDAARRAMGRGERSLLHFLDAERLVLDAAALHPFAHWITPEGAPRRYDTRFFVAEAPAGHQYLHDDGETVASLWIRPRHALERNEAGELELIFPTMRSLVALSRFSRAGDVLEVARAAPGATERPRAVRDVTGYRIPLPGDEEFVHAAPVPSEGVA